ncbi:hypothetical protein B296_00035008 [Ensete ventricosum]|uniref:Uncharacterized protein n=1 Tax=Ensete ventricosum TaxID=4639 RepID=A0A426ZYM6_ENSVE|nr:hypothetical protein B296_00035008 [Ensete ventricosum]
MSVPGEEEEVDCYDYCCCMGCNTSTTREAGKRERKSGAGGRKGGRVALGRGGKHESSKEWRSDRKRKGATANACLQAPEMVSAVGQTVVMP